MPVHEGGYYREIVSQKIVRVIALAKDGDGSSVVVYADQAHQVWVAPEKVFCDGRYALVPRDQVENKP
jgi:hypothetical protein